VTISSNNKLHLAGTPAELAALVRAVRVSSGMTQAEAAAFCGVSAPFLGGLEAGKPTAQLGLVLKVCRELGIRIVADLPEPDLDVALAPERKPRSGGKP
jgi:HTH-type transcriptional regulator / antitoxin HipB